MKGYIRKRGKSWYYTFDLAKVNGKRNKIERKGGTTKGEAISALNNALRKYENLDSQIYDSNVIFKDYIYYWVNEYVTLNCKYSTKERYERYIKNQILPYLSDYKLIDLKPIVLQNFINEISDKNYSKDTVQSINSILKLSLKMAVFPYNILKINPMEGVRIPKFDETKKDRDDLKIISTEDFNKILKRFPEGDRFHTPLQLGFGTGMRASEVCGLTWDCVDLTNGTIRIEKILVEKDKKWIFSTPKTSSSCREIFIGETVQNCLKKQKKYQALNKLKYGEKYYNSKFVCTDKTGNPITSNNIKYLSYIINHKLGIRFKFHSLRHTHATLLLENDVNIKEIQERLGHSTCVTTMNTYTHLTRKIKQDSINKLELINSKLK
ncbi:tyrosine-type recombinase/integrase [Clostridium sp. DL1XJH146]